MYKIEQITDIEQIVKLLELQDVVYQKLQTEGHADFILLKTKSDYKKLLKDKNCSIVGIFDEKGNLVGQSVVKHSKHKNNEDNLLSFSSEDSYEIGNVLIHPDHNGKGLAKKMIECIKSLPQYQDKVLTAEIEKDNLSSMKTFLSCGFIGANLEKSPLDEAEVFLLFFDKNLSAQITESDTVEINQNLEFHEYEELSKTGLMVVGYKRIGQHINSSQSQVEQLKSQVFTMKKSNQLLKTESDYLAKLKQESVCKETKQNYFQGKISFVEVMLNNQNSQVGFVRC